MRLLFVAPYPPWPLHGGTPIRMYNLLRELARAGHRITLLAGTRGDLPPDHPLEDVCVGIRTFKTGPSGPLWKTALGSLGSPDPYPFHRYLNAGYDEALDQVLEAGTFDLAFVNFLFLAGPVLDRVPPRTKVVVDQHEAQELVWREYLRDGAVHERLFASINLAKVRLKQRALLEQIDALVAVSQMERDLAVKRHPGLQAWYAPNGVALDGRSAPTLEGSVPDRIMICGNFGINRNAEAAIWFTEEVFPQVRQARPSAEFWIVGTSPGPRVRDLERVDGVHVTGKVPDVAPYYRQARMVVAPFHHGAGTKLKVLEAMGAGRPVVSTPNGVRGLDVDHGSEVLVAGDPNTFASEVVEVLDDRNVAGSLAATAYELVADRYSWAGIADGLEASLLELTRSEGAGRDMGGPGPP